MSRLKDKADHIAPVVALLMLLAVWELGVRLYEVPIWILPAPSAIVKTIGADYQLLLLHTGSTLLEAVLGFVLAIILAFFMAFLLSNVRCLERAISPLLIVSQTIPLIVLAVLLPLWFGWGITPKIMIVILVCFFPIVINLMDGLHSVDHDQINLFRSMGAKSMDIFKMVKLPAALPAFFSGLKISATYAIMAAIIAEWIGAKQGLGYFMTIKQKSFAIDEVLAAVVVICFLSLLLVKLVEILEYYVVPWNRNPHTSAGYEEEF